VIIGAGWVYIISLFSELILFEISPSTLENFLKTAFKYLSG
jgi:hypothetical protein